MESTTSKISCYPIEVIEHSVIHGMPFDSLVCFPFQADEISHVIAELEKSIARYKEEYAGLISQAQAIKADLAAVEAKVRVIAYRIKPCHSRRRQANDEAQSDNL